MSRSLLAPAHSVSSQGVHEREVDLESHCDDSERMAAASVAGHASTHATARSCQLYAIVWLAAGAVDMAHARPEAPAKRARLQGTVAPHGGGTAAATAARVVVDKCLEVSLAKGTNTSCLVGICVTGIHIYICIYIYTYTEIYTYLVPHPWNTQVSGQKLTFGCKKCMRNTRSSF